MRKTGICEPSATGISSPACAISDSSPAVLSATVFPPVFGPVMTSTLTGRNQDDIDGTGDRARVRDPARDRVRAIGSRLLRDVPPDRRDEQRVPRRAQFEAAVGRDRGLDAVDGDRELRARLQHVELGRRANRPLEIVAAGGGSASASAEKDPTDLFGLLLLERDDVVVDFDGAERLEKEAGAAAGAAVDDPGNRGPVLGSDDEDVPAVAIGDDLLLQVLRRVLAAQIRLERAAQPRALLAKPIAQALQLRARIVDDLAAGIDLATDVGDLAFEGRRRVGDASQHG